LDVEDRLPRLDERRQQVALLELKALLIERPVERRHESRHLIEIVLQPDGQTACVSRTREVSIVLQLISGRERKPGIVAVPIDVVELDPIESLGPAKLHPGIEDRAQQIDSTDVE